MNKRRLRQGIVGIGVSYFALWACAPALSGPPPTPGPAGQHSEAMVGAAGGLLDLTPLPAYSLQAHFQRQVGTHVAFGLDGFVGVPTLLGGGVHTELAFVSNDAFRMQLTLGVGWLNARASLDFAFRAGPNAWVYLRPTAGYMIGPFRAPIGAVIDVGDRTLLSIEAVPAFHAGDFGTSELDPALFGNNDGLSIQVGVGLTWRFGYNMAPAPAPRPDGSQDVPLPEL